MKTKSKESIKSRVFLVGCPRSGTTLLQSLLAAHPKIASFPESFFFNYLVPSKSLLRNLGIASRWAKPQLMKFLDECNHPEMKHYLPKMGLFMNQYAQAFIEILDTLTVAKDKNIWLEKTPSHLHYINYIEKFVEDTKFIHIIRNGQDVVASIYEVTNKYPEFWRGAKNIDQCIEIWSRAVQASKEHLSKPNHILVRYEKLLENPQSVLNELCEYIEISFDPTIFNTYGAAAKQVILNNEPWKESVNQGIKKINSSKFFQLFDEAKQQYILERISLISSKNKNDNNLKLSMI